MPRLSVRDNAIAIVLSACLFAVYLLTYRGGFHSVDEVSMFAVTENMVKRGAVDTNQVAWTQWTTTQRESQGFFGRDGSVYSKKGLALSLFAAPFYWLALRVPGVGLLQTVSLLNALITAATGAVLYLYARRLAYSAPAAVLLGLTFGLASTAWVYARYLFSEPLSGALLLLAAYFLLAFRQCARPRALYLLAAGFAAGLTVLTRANNVIVLPIFALYLLATWIDRNSAGRFRAVRGWWKQGILFGTAIAAPLALMMVHNWVRAGNPFQTGYDLTIFTPSLALGLYKLLLSPLRGLFGFSPVLLLSLVAFHGFARRHRPEALLAVGIVGVNVVLFSAWTSGEGLSWGSRFMVPVLAFWTLPLLEPLQGLATGRRLRWMPGLLALGGLSVLIQMLGVLVNPWLHMIRLHELFPTEFLENTPALYELRYSPILGQLQELFFMTPAKADVAWWQPGGVQTVPLALSLAVVVACAWALWRLLRRTDADPGVASAAIPAFSLAFVAVASLVCLRAYYRADYQFGQPDNSFYRLWDRIEAEGAPGDGIVTIAPLHYHVAMNRYKGPLPILGFAQMNLPLAPQAVTLLEAALVEHGRLWLVTAGQRPGEPKNGVERWLSERAFKARDEWYDDYRLCLFAVSPAVVSPTPASAVFGDAIRLQSYTVNPARPRAGSCLALTLDWQAQSRVESDYTVFVHLVGPDGRPVAQQDGMPVGGFAPTSGWPAGVAISDRHGLILPMDLAPGRYEVWVGLYDGERQDRLAVRSTGASESDHLVLAAVEVERP